MGAQTLPNGLQDGESISWLDLPYAPATDPELVAIWQHRIEKGGYVPNGLRTLAEHPQLALAKERLGAVAKGGLSPREAELIALVISHENRCVPCVRGHIRHLTRVSGDADWATKVSVSWRRAGGISDRERAILEFAEKLTRAPAEMDEADIAALRSAGLQETEIIDVTGAAAFYNFVNRLNNALGVVANKV